MKLGNEIYVCYLFPNSICPIPVWNRVKQNKTQDNDRSDFLFHHNLYSTIDLFHLSTNASETLHTHNETGSIHFVSCVCGGVEVKSVVVALARRPQFEGLGGDTTLLQTFTQNFVKISPAVLALA